MMNEDLRRHGYHEVHETYFNDHTGGSLNKKQTKTLENLFEIEKEEQEALEPIPNNTRLAY